jgi:hypothetical protein
MQLEFSRQIFEKYSNFTKIHPVVAELLRGDRGTDRRTEGQREGQTDGRTEEETMRETDRHDEANSRFSQFCERA